MNENIRADLVIAHSESPLRLIEIEQSARADDVACLTDKLLRLLRFFRSSEAEKVDKCLLILFNLASDDQQTLPIWQKVIAAIEKQQCPLPLQLDPTNKFARGMRNRLLDGKVLSEGQAEAMQKIIDEMGGIQVILVARDQLRRLSILGSLKELSQKDAETVSSLLNHLLRQEYLSDKQNRLIYALQDKYSDEVLEYTCQLISAWPPIGGWLWKFEERFPRRERPSFFPRTENQGQRAAPIVG